MTPRARIIEHGIVLQDFSGIGSVPEALAAIAEARTFMAARAPDRSTLLLTDVTGSTFTQEVVDALRGLAEHHRPYVKASAIVGLTAIMRVVYRMLVAITRRDIKLFESREEAVEYLKTL
jgi:hypothetical protein